MKIVNQYPTNPWEIQIDTACNTTIIMDENYVVYSLYGIMQLPTQNTTDNVNSNGITANDLLKAIAVSQNPELIKDIT